MMSTTAGADANAAPKKEKPKGKKKEGDSKYSKTVLLPITSFDQRANSLKRLVNDKPSLEDSAPLSLVDENQNLYEEASIFFFLSSFHWFLIINYF